MFSNRLSLAVATHVCGADSSSLATGTTITPTSGWLQFKKTCEVILMVLSSPVRSRMEEESQSGGVKQQSNVRCCQVQVVVGAQQGGDNDDAHNCTCAHFFQDGNGVWLQNTEKRCVTKQGAARHGKRDFPAGRAEQKGHRFTGRQWQLVESATVSTQMGTRINLLLPTSVKRCCYCLFSHVYTEMSTVK